MRSALFDSGANGSINTRDCEPFLMNSEKSRCSITVANNQRLEVGMDGILPIMVINTAEKAESGKANDNAISDSTHRTRLDIETTTADVPMELISFDPFYQSEMWGLHVEPNSAENAKAELYKISDDGEREITVPLRYDWSGQGGFWLDYLIIENPKEEHKEWLGAAHREFKVMAAVSTDEIQVFDIKQVRAMVGQIKDDDAVNQVIASDK